MYAPRPNGKGGSDAIGMSSFRGCGLSRCTPTTYPSLSDLGERITIELRRRGGACAGVKPERRRATRPDRAYGPDHDRRIPVCDAVGRMIRVVLALQLPLLLATLPLAAQTVGGIVLEEGSGAPIEGAMVVLLDSAEHVAARTITDATGRFLAEVPQPGRYHARVDRIGYRSLTTDPFDVPPDGTFRRILVPIRAVVLAGLDVSGSARCRLRAEVGEATVTVWEEARKALEAAAWTLESGRYAYTLLNSVRRLDRDGEQILDEDRDLLSGWGQSPYMSRPAQELADSGYVRELPEGGLSYFAPDAEVLLSDAFLDTHCMRVQAGEDGLVGLAFEPLGGGTLPEIRGVLWMDAATAMLTRLEFRYVNLTWGRAAGDAGGVVTFERLPAGTWVVRDWHIRMPLLQLTGSRYDRTGYQEKGGMVWRVIDPSGIVVREAAAGTVAGQVTDSLGREPLPGAVVTARGMGIRAVSDSAGAFVLSGLPAGHSFLDVAHPSLDTLGLVQPDPVSVEVEERDTVRVRLRVPGVYEVLSRACAESDLRRREARRPSGTAIVLGRVRDGGHAAAGVTVRLGWLAEVEEMRADDTPAVPPQRPGGSGGAPVWRRVQLPAQRWLEAALDERGTFLLCDIASPSQLRVSATSGDLAAELTVAVTREERLRIASVTVQPVRAQQQGVLRGRVLDATTEEPVSAATISIIGGDDVALVTSSTGARGRFSLPVLDSGTFRVRAGQLGYRTAVSDPVRLSPRDTVEIDLWLTPAPVLLDSILVSVRRAGRSLRAGEQLVYGRLLDDDTRSPITGGIVRLVAERRSAVADSTITDDQGHFWLISPRAGTYRLQGERIGYMTSESPTLQLMLGDSIGMDFYLSTQAVLLAPITVNASRRAWSDRANLVGMEGFLSRYERFAKMGFGTLMIRDSIASWEGRVMNVGNMLLARAPQVRTIVPYGDPSARELGGAVVMRGGRASGGIIQPYCIPTYYLNGVRVPYEIVSTYGPADLEAVEVYVSPEIPAELSVGRPCGVVAYWSRRTPGRAAIGKPLRPLLLVAAVVIGGFLILR